MTKKKKQSKKIISLILWFFSVLLALIIGLAFSPYFENLGIQYWIQGRPFVQVELQSSYLEDYAIAGNTDGLDPEILIINQLGDDALISFFKTENKNFEGEFGRHSNLDYSKLVTCNCTQNWMTIKNIGKKDINGITIYFETSEEIYNFTGITSNIDFAQGQDVYYQNNFNLFIPKLNSGEEAKFYFLSKNKMSPIKSCESEGKTKYCKTIFSTQMVSKINDLVLNNSFHAYFSQYGNKLYLTGFNESNFMYKYNFFTGIGERICPDIRKCR
jgi:hypothetical protein